MSVAPLIELISGAWIVASVVGCLLVGRAIRFGRDSIPSQHRTSTPRLAHMVGSCRNDTQKASWQLIRDRCI